MPNNTPQWLRVECFKRWLHKDKASFYQTESSGDYLTQPDNVTGDISGTLGRTLSPRCWQQSTWTQQCPHRAAVLKSNSSDDSRPALLALKEKSPCETTESFLERQAGDISVCLWKHTTTNITDHQVWEAMSTRTAAFISSLLYRQPPPPHHQCEHGQQSHLGGRLSTGWLYAYKSKHFQIHLTSYHIIRLPQLRRIGQNPTLIFYSGNKHHCSLL